MNTTTIQAIYYTSQFNIKFKVQSRMLQKNSDNVHYCAALFQYLREFCIQYHQWACLISANNKYKISIREDTAVSMGVQNRHFIVFQESTLATADHDFLKLSLTPSVIFFISIPNDISRLFYNKQVFVSYKDTILEPSTAIRYSTEFLNALRIQYVHQEMPPILCFYTDRGLDHHCNYGLVQIALLTLKHDSMSPESELLFGIANTLDDIHKKAQEFSKLESELNECISGIQELLNSQTK
ncbi:23986_t:CDS:2 [Gigaspora margarita]|uniref:23986_t:CDS:1 n=1 Tax=Gigaspora margarita TaxID=4874 RepID=A0ABN7VYG4_GIGMA|nr:23986_t:CDS:2 [Gigaspora margarita]